MNSTGNYPQAVPEPAPLPILERLSRLETFVTDIGGNLREVERQNAWLQAELGRVLGVPVTPPAAGPEKVVDLRAFGR